MADAPESDNGGSAPDDGDQAFASVIHVGRQDDVATICGRIDTAPSYAVVIAAPAGNRSLNREIGLRRVIRHAEESGRSIAFATTNAALASRARAHRIPVARKPEHVRWDSGGRVVWRLGGRSFAVPAAGRLMQILVIAGFAALVAVLLFTVAPPGTVIAYPPSESREEVITVTASTSVDEPDFENLELPAREVSSSRLVTVAIPTTGSVVVGTVPAQLTITVTNTTAEEVTIPAGSQLRTNEGLVFAIDSEATLAPGETQYLASTAAEPGEVGNIPPNSIIGFVDPSLSLIRAENAGNGGGGLSEPRPGVADEDIVTLTRTAQALGSVDAVRETIVADRPRDAILLDTATVEVDLGEPSPLPGQPGQIVVMEVEVRVTALAVVAEVLNELGRVVLTQEGDTGELIAGSVSAVETESDGSADSGDVTTQLRLRADFTTEVTRKEVEDAVRGLSTEGAQSILESRYGIQEAEVDVWPGWAPRLSRFGFRTDVEFRSPPDDDESPTNNGQ